VSQLNIEIVPLDHSHVSNIISLIAGYLNSASNGIDESAATPEQLEHCESILHKFLSQDAAQLFLAKLHNEYIGFIALSWSFSLSKGGSVLRIDALYSSPNYRNKGVGRKLMQYAIGLAIERNASRLQLETDDENTPARTLYTNLGFHLIDGKSVYMLFL
jgi:ribosomal protein S18 acetylase RimI-like enzyme